MHWTSPPRKHLGQNFLQDPCIISDILHSAQFKRSDKVIEIGPGRGALTQPLLRQLDHLIAIELDRELYDHWSQYDSKHLTVLCADALTVDFRQWGEPIHVIGNLPYHISTPLLIHLLTQRDVIRSMHFMLQKEVVQRLVAEPGTKDYGRLTVLMQAFCELRWLFDVPPEAFYPQPKVMSAVMSIRPLPLSQQASVEIHQLEKVVGRAFAMRRKTLANNLKQHYCLQKVEAMGINLKARPEEISVGEYIALARI
jgi:16S rRNA (adenine1518-N6/adenine1519-N6)-dimethyltransferase